MKTVNNFSTYLTSDDAAFPIYLLPIARYISLCWSNYLLCRRFLQRLSLFRD